MQYNKLVRDKIPEIIKSNGDVPVTHIASDNEYKNKLREKLQEEVKEYLESSKTEELADILEVISALADTHQVSFEEIQKSQKDKHEKRGGFKEKIILEETK